jgi:hypothetical protein
MVPQANGHPLLEEKVQSRQPPPQAPSDHNHSERTFQSVACSSSLGRPPPFSAMNSTPAFSKAATWAAPVSARPSRSPSAGSSLFMVGDETPDRTCRQDPSCDQPTNSLAVAHPKGGNGNFQHGGRTKEAVSASRYVDRLARLLHDAAQSRYKWRPRTTASPTVSNGVLLQRTKSHAARFHPALPPGRLLVGDVYNCSEKSAAASPLTSPCTR